MASTNLTFSNTEEHRAWLASQAALPQGFRVGGTRFTFAPHELPTKPAAMALTLIALDEPTPSFGAVFTKNAFPGAPIVVGRRRRDSEKLGAIIVNNKISNVCAPGGVETAERVCAETARLLGIAPDEVLPSSTGVIGWRLPEKEFLAALPAAVSSLAGGSVLPAAQSIVTTDLYPKIRRHDFPAAPGATHGGSIVAIGKGAGMIEPNLATMLVYILTDVAIPCGALCAMLADAVEQSFNCISIDSDTSTSDTVAIVSSNKVPCPDFAEFGDALNRVCRDLAEDIVRNGEGVRHVMRVTVTGARDSRAARELGKAVINAPLFKCAVAGNDPNVGRLVQALGKYVGIHAPDVDVSRLRASIGGIEIFANGEFRLNPEKEAALAAHFRAAELYASRPDANGIFVPPLNYPPHERTVEIAIDIGTGGEASASVIGGDLTHEYISENADYRS